MQQLSSFFLFPTHPIKPWQFFEHYYYRAKNGKPTHDGWCPIVRGYHEDVDKCCGDEKSHIDSHCPKKFLLISFMLHPRPDQHLYPYDEKQHIIPVEKDTEPIMKIHDNIATSTLDILQNWRKEYCCYDHTSYDISYLCPSTFSRQHGHQMHTQHRQDGDTGSPNFAPEQHIRPGTHDIFGQLEHTQKDEHQNDDPTELIESIPIHHIPC